MSRPTAFAAEAGPAGADARGRFCLQFPGAPLEIRRALGLVRRWLSSRGIEEDACDTVEIVLAEALNNVAEHAYGDESTGPVDLHMTHGPGWVQLTIRDRGQRMPGGCLPRACTGTGPDPATLPEGGFGWSLIRTLSQELTYRRTGARNELCIRIAT